MNSLILGLARGLSLFRFALGVGLLLETAAAESSPKSTAPPGYGTINALALELKSPAGTKPLIDYWMRDTYVTRGPDGFYSLTGTTADPHRHFDEKGPHCW